MDYQEAKAILEESKANAVKQSLREQAERQQEPQSGKIL